jgi:hypothetical protein
MNHNILQTRVKMIQNLFEKQRQRALFNTRVCSDKQRPRVPSTRVFVYKHDDDVTHRVARIECRAH